jgi:transposase-like protein
MATKGQQFKHYPEELKREVVKERIEKNTSFLELAFRYKISSQESIMQWVKNYQKFGDAAFNDKRGTATSKTSALKGRPRKYFTSDEEKNKYEAVVKERNRKRALERRRLARVRKKRALKKEA